MCGIERPLGLLVPDGGGACADIHWYCKDVKSCTERWTAALPDRDDGTGMPLSGCVQHADGGRGTGRPGPLREPRLMPGHRPARSAPVNPAHARNGTGLPPVPAWAAPKNR